MGIMVREKRGLAVILLSFLLMGMDGPPRESGDKRQLEERQAQLADRIEALKRDQEFLLFQRSLATIDSKYLILDLRAGKGMLKYRGRILRNFNFPLMGKPLPAGRKQGVVTLTGKLDGSPVKRQLVFTDPLLIIGSKHVSTGKAKSKKGIRIILGTKDLSAIFYTLEMGSLAYILN
jgi:hypothetical protein